ncbi:hypothetical protein [Ammoniphilus oxalaticus]|uniref:hypothetical protein n=1 Tax=Ammoniphilus oxalaticus TaxID=66863 RepID=UPI0011C44F95|nr:hypothetical protein [Ammoniphilus oxalaticus]
MDKALALLARNRRMVVIGALWASPLKRSERAAFIQSKTTERWFFPYFFQLLRRMTSWRIWFGFQCDLPWDMGDLSALMSDFFTI